MGQSFKRLYFCKETTLTNDKSEALTLHGYCELLPVQEHSQWRNLYSKKGEECSYNVTLLIKEITSMCNLYNADQRGRNTSSHSLDSIITVLLLGRFPLLVSTHADNPCDNCNSSHVGCHPAVTDIHCFSYITS